MYNISFRNNLYHTQNLKQMEIKKKLLKQIHIFIKKNVKLNII